MATILFAFNFITNGNIFYALPFLELFPDYNCPINEPDCGPSDHCRDPNRYPIDWNSTKSLHNWVEVYHLECEKPYRIALLGSVYFIGEVLFTVLVTRLGDVYGRKWVCWICSALSVPIQLGFLLSTNLTFTIALFFLLGACTPGKLHISFVYLTELVPERYRTAVGTVILFSDASTMAWQTLYFRLVTKEWIYFQILSLVMNIIAVLGILFLIPESPKYQHAVGKIEECQKNMQYIAKVNGKGMKEIEEIKIMEMKE